MTLQSLSSLSGKPSFLLRLALCGLARLGEIKAAPVNFSPPSGPILDLAGTSAPSPCAAACIISSTFTKYSVNFTATFALTDITFALRNDPNFTALDDISVTNLTTGLDAGLLNGGFESGLLNWRYDNVYGAIAGGIVTTTCTGITPHGGSSQYCDGAVQAYDAIDQFINTTIGDTYQITFWTAAKGFTGSYQQLSTNGNITSAGGNGIDTLVYVGSDIPAASTPEPGSMLMIASDFLGLGFLRRCSASK